MPTISTLVAIYNVEDYLIKCLDSIRNQTYKDIEVVCVDDGSTDTSGKICEEYAKVDSRFKVIHQENKGLVRARKRALAEAKGEYICFVDGDDYVDNNFCEDLLQLIHEYKADFVSTGYYQDDRISHKNNTKLLVLNDESRKGLIAEQIGTHITYNVATSICTKMFKRELIKKCYGKVPDYQSFGEDLLCSIHCFLEARCLLISDLALYHYVVRKGSLTRKNFSEMVASEISLVKEIRNILEHTPEYADYKIMIDHRVKRQIAFFLKNNCDKGYMVQYYELEDISKLLGKNVVLYGAGVVGQDLFTQLSRNQRIDIAAWIDKCPEKYMFDYYKVQGIDDIKSIDFDIALICVNNENTSQEMIDTLCDMGVDREKILWHKPKNVFED